MMCAAANEGFETSREWTLNYQPGKAVSSARGRSIDLLGAMFIFMMVMWVLNTVLGLIY
jgi:hypothetical protein